MSRLFFLFLKSLIFFFIAFGFYSSYLTNRVGEVVYVLNRQKELEREILNPGKYLIWQKVLPGLYLVKTYKTKRLTSSFQLHEDLEDLPKEFSIDDLKCSIKLTLLYNLNRDSLFENLSQFEFDKNKLMSHFENTMLILIKGKMREYYSTNKNSTNSLSGLEIRLKKYFELEFFKDIELKLGMIDPIQVSVLEISLPNQKLFNSFFQNNQLISTIGKELMTARIEAEKLEILERKKSEIYMDRLESLRKFLVKHPEMKAVIKLNLEQGSPSLEFQSSENNKKKESKKNDSEKEVKIIE